VIDEAALSLAKAEASLTGAERELEDGRYNNCANRCYYACFQAAICALMRAGIRPSGGRGEWGHNFVPAPFEGVLINRRKLYSTGLRDVLTRNYGLRRQADYEGQGVTRTETSRALRRARTLVQAIRGGGGTKR